MCVAWYATHDVEGEVVDGGERDPQADGDERELELSGEVHAVHEALEDHYHRRREHLVSGWIRVKMEWAL